MDLQTFMKERKKLVEEALFSYVNTVEAPQALLDSMSYSLKAGGKRLRPLLVLATLHSFGKSEKLGLPVACAVEMIHTYSLIHDDLPSMDDDDYRRGKPTNHKVYGEAMAILAGDALLTYSFEVMEDLLNLGVSPIKVVTLMKELSKASGPTGMVGGQVADMEGEGEGKALSLEELEYIHRNKTGKLLGYSVMAGAILGDASEEQISKLTLFADHLGLAFQIRDDILDIEGDAEKIGKPVGSDTLNEKVTYPSLLSMDGAKEKLEYHISEAKRLLSDMSLKSDLLSQLCDLIAKRDH
ncbi:polyprenyl synthetase family protein [Sutcliffiella horikoshii]|uniref:polyprenyl synthetase family protein n=1 Tax=Sutcliffiella horikoshii TaxID=79883 RepID=UPI001F43C635|nr:farnesyl diphosphate synthase [Sutcliffiella horikoshii]MCG1022785.1 polyprenyl synthetase family protein [Sutcliffiella horikoshii]